jgi:hypothetical protein
MYVLAQCVVGVKVSAWMPHPAAGRTEHVAKLSSAAAIRGLAVSVGHVAQFAGILAV